MKIRTREGVPKRILLVVSLAAVAVLSQNRFLHSFQQEHRLSFEPSVESKSDDLNKLPSTDRPHAFPLIIGAGQGTTGTRSIQKAVCKLGIPSVHFNQACHQGIPLNSTIFPNTKQGVDAHIKVIETWKELRDCVHEARKQGNVCVRAQHLLTIVRKHVTEVIQSDIGAIHDTPYTMMIPYILKVARETRGSEPILILTERNPHEWAARRVQSHGDTPQLVCNDPRGAFDIDYCLDSGLNATQLFHIYPNSKNSGEQQKEYMSLLEKTMQHYQQTIRQLSPVYIVNMFESKERIEPSTFEQSIWDGSKSRWSSTALKELSLSREQGGLVNKWILGSKTGMPTAGRKKRPRRPIRRKSSIAKLAYRIKP